MLKLLKDCLKWYKDKFVEFGKKCDKKNYDVKPGGVMEVPEGKKFQSFYIKSAEEILQETIIDWFEYALKKGDREKVKKQFNSCIESIECIKGYVIDNESIVMGMPPGDE